MERRDFLILTGGAFAARHFLPSNNAPHELATSMYGLIGRITANPGERDALAEILLKGAGAMPGCLSYIVAADPSDPDALWVTEVWESADLHRASLTLPAVQEAIARGRPLIAGFDQRAETVPFGGHGLVAASDS